MEKMKSLNIIIYQSRHYVITMPSETGLLIRQHIEQLGHLTPEGYWDFNWSEDRFVINGITYKPSGDTQVAQAKDEALVFMVILKRDRDTKIQFVE